MNHHHVHQPKDQELLITNEEVEQLKQCLPKIPTLGNDKVQMIQYQGYWCLENALPSILKFQRHFQARDTDIIIMGLPKTGSTWLKSLLFATVNRAENPIDQTSLLTSHPQELVYSLESDLYAEAFAYPRPHHLSELPSPRLFSTHLPYTSLPESIKDSKCRILYLCRNPLDTFVSMYHFEINHLKKAVGEDFQPPSFEECFAEYIEGKYPRGPFFEHVIEFWKLSVEHPDKVLFLKYEDLKTDPITELKRIADFVGLPFSPEEESEGVVSRIVEFCSIGNMKELEVNKNGVINKFFEKKTYFRKGKVGDWRNHFSETMVEKITKLMEEKCEGTGLSIKLLP